MASEFRTATKGKYESLAGVKGDYLVARAQNDLACPAGYTRVLDENPRRVHAFITNTDPGDAGDTSLQLDLDAIVDGYFLLGYQDVFTIDKDTPWTGPVTVNQAVGTTGYVSYVEVSVE